MGNSTHISERDLKKNLSNLGYSLRRYHVDLFHLDFIHLLGRNARVLDLGGDGKSKRGCFDLHAFCEDVTVLNLSSAKSPDVIGLAEQLPFQDLAFDCVICSEVLEHIWDVDAVLSEIIRVLAPGGHVILGAPFLYRVHGDPDDFRRFTGNFWRRKLGDLGASIVEERPQGYFWSVFADMLRGHVVEWFAGRRRGISWRLTAAIVTRIEQKAVEWDRVLADGASVDNKAYYRSFTTGFGVVARKR